MEIDISTPSFYHTDYLSVVTALQRCEKGNTRRLYQVGDSDTYRCISRGPHKDKEENLVFYVDTYASAGKGKKLKKKAKAKRLPVNNPSELKALVQNLGWLRNPFKVQKKAGNNATLLSNLRKGVTAANLQAAYSPSKEVLNNLAEASLKDAMGMPTEAKVPSFKKLFPNGVPVGAKKGNG